MFGDIFSNSKEVTLVIEKVESHYFNEEKEVIIVSVLGMLVLRNPVGAVLFASKELSKYSVYIQKNTCRYEGIEFLDHNDFREEFDKLRDKYFDNPNKEAAGE